MNHWKCTVCNYWHKGDSPPDKCPTCKAPTDKFLSQEPPAAIKRKKRTRHSDNTFLSTIGDPLDRLHAHPVTVHIPNGVLPVSLLFLVIGIFFGSENLMTAAFYNMVAVFLSMPFVILTGIISWKYKFRGILTPLFRSKLIAGTVVWLISGIVVFWQILTPLSANSENWQVYIMLILNGILIFAAAYAGYLGGKLVFKR